MRRWCQISRRSHYAARRVLHKLTCSTLPVEAGEKCSGKVSRCLTRPHLGASCTAPATRWRTVWRTSKRAPNHRACWRGGRAQEPCSDAERPEHSYPAHRPTAQPVWPHFSRFRTQPAIEAVPALIAARAADTIAESLHRVHRQSHTPPPSPRVPRDANQAFNDWVDETHGPTRTFELEPRARAVLFQT